LAGSSGGGGSVNRSPLSLEDSTTGEFDPGILRRLNQFVTSCSVLAFGFGAWVLIGWMLHIHWMKSILAGQVAVKANTAACFVLGSEKGTPTGRCRLETGSQACRRSGQCSWAALSLRVHLGLGPGHRSPIVRRGSG
jgi:hypothetical protein